jgi:hypothetical protein
MGPGEEVFLRQVNFEGVESCGEPSRVQDQGFPRLYVGMQFTPHHGKDAFNCDGGYCDEIIETQPIEAWI